MKKLHNILKMRVTILVALISIILLQWGCKKMIEVDLPIDKNTAETVYSNAGTAVSVLNGIYIRLSKNSFAAGPGGISVNTGLLADELVDDNGGEKYKNSYQGDPTGFWQQMYSEYIFRVNSVIEGVSASKGIPEGTKHILIGEAKVLRALIYFNLVNLYGDVPLVITTDFKINSNIPRSPKKIVYDLIIKDLTEAQVGLTDQYLGSNLKPTTERVAPNRFAATALLAKVYLYLGRWTEAEAESTKIINNVGVYELSALNDVFLANSKEAIWQLQTIPDLDPDGNGDSFTIAGDARYFIPLTDDIPPVYVSSYVLNAFEANDNRKDAWIRYVTSGTESYPIPNKYKAGRDRVATDPEYTMVIRLAEQYLIRAEARAQQNKIVGVNSAESDLNAIRSRAGLSGTTATDQTTMFNAILKERQVELFTEWGHRWFDLKRMGKINTIMDEVAPVKGGTWAPYKALLPIPADEFKLNPALRGHQNPGYLEPSN